MSKKLKPTVPLSLNRQPLNTEVTVWGTMWVVIRNGKNPYPQSEDYLCICHDPEVAEAAKDNWSNTWPEVRVIKATFVWLNNSWWRTYAKPENNIIELSPTYDLTTDVTVTVRPMSFWKRLAFLVTGRYEYRTTAKPY